MKRLYLVLGVLLCFTLVSAQESGHKVNVESYAQLRLSSDLAGNNTFQIRRLKFKFTSPPSFSPHWSYYMKFEISSKHFAMPSLLDLRVGYKTGNFKFYFGQFLPDFSLERFQSDTKISTVERAEIVDDFIPAGGMGKRDLGLQVSYCNKNKSIYTSLGVFNGRGVSQWKYDNSTYLVVHKAYITHRFDSTGSVQAGYSMMYRHAQDLPLSTILGQGALFTGDDYRVNGFLSATYKNLFLQAEVIKLWLNGAQAWGYYALADYTLHKHQFVLSVEKKQDLDNTTADDPLFYVGYNYLLKGNDLKVSLAYSWQMTHGQIVNNLLLVQLQIFFLK